MDEFAGWRMVDRFAGFRYEVTGRVHDVGFHEETQKKADDLGCFGWIQDSARGTLVGEARCAKAVAPYFKEWLRSGPDEARVADVAVHDYPDTKIKLHFSHFKILTPDRKTCFPTPPHQCDEGTTRPSTTEASIDARAEL